MILQSEIGSLLHLLQENYQREIYMNKDELSFEYDDKGDILYISKIKSYKEQESDEIQDGVIARLNPTTQEIESLEILSFKKRLAKDSSFTLPIIARLMKSA